MPTPPTGTVTFLFADIEGSTRLWERERDAMEARVARNTAILQKVISAHHGTIFKVVSDATFVAFTDPQDALAAALDAQRAILAQTAQPDQEVHLDQWALLTQRTLPHTEAQPDPASAAPATAQDAALGLRMAIHTGAVESRDGDYFGQPLNRAARLLAAGHNGQILLTQAAEQMVRDGLPGDVALRSLGERWLKDLRRPEQIFQVLTQGLPADFPPLVTLEAHAHNLPVQLTSFVGRTHEMGKVAALIGSQRLITITGPGGCGKTRIALQVAADLVEHFTDGVWFAALEPIEAAPLVAQTVAKALGVQEEPGRPMTATLVDHLAGRTALIVLDNCEHVLDACAHLATALLSHCPEVRILATSRSGLNVSGETVWPLPPLALPPRAPGKLTGDDLLAELTHNEAARLFTERAMAVQPDFQVTESNAASLFEICYRLDGIPLALELAAARVKVLSLDQLAKRLDDRLQLLTGGSRTASARQQTLRGTIDWSHDLLSDPERTFFRRLSVFRGGFTLEAAEAVCAADAAEAGAAEPGGAESRNAESKDAADALDVVDVLDLLGDLVDKSLVQVDDHGTAVRYHMLESIRQYARERLLAAGEAVGVRERLLRWCAALAQAADPALRGPDEAAWSERLEKEHDNLRAALDWVAPVLQSPMKLVRPQAEGPSAAIPAELAADGLALGGNLSYFWQQHGYVTEGRERLEALIALPQAGAYPGLLARVQNGAAVLAMDQGDFGAASALFKDGLVLARSARAQAIEAELLTNVGTLAYRQSEFGQARDAYEAALVVWRTQDDQVGMGRTLNNLGTVAMNAGNSDAAHRYYEEALPILKAIGHQSGLSTTLRNLGILALRRTDYAEARAAFTQALAVQRSLDHRAQIATSLNLLGLVAYYERDLTSARLAYAESLAIRHDLDDRLGEAVVMRDMALLELRAGDLASAEARIHECLLLHRILGKNLSLPEALEAAAYVAVGHGDWPRAAQLLGAAESIRTDAGLPIDPDAIAEHEAAVHAVRDGLGVEAANRAWAAGRAIDWQAALASALGETAAHRTGD